MPGPRRLLHLWCGMKACVALPHLLAVLQFCKPPCNTGPDPCVHKVNPPFPEVLGSLKCDCSEQLALAMRIIQERDGIIIYLQQEGRGIGLANKIAAYALQEQGLDTVDANRALGLPDDCREYTSVKNILHNLGIKSIRLVVGVGVHIETSCTHVPFCTDQQPPED